MLPFSHKLKLIWWILSTCVLVSSLEEQELNIFYLCQLNVGDLDTG